MSGTLVRAPNHLGDAVLALPALRAAEPAAVQVAAGLAPLLALAGVGGRLLPLERGPRGLLSAVGDVRRGGYRRGVLLTPSFSSALVFVLAGVPQRRGEATDGRRRLLTDAVPPAHLAGLHRAAAYVLLATGTEPPSPPVPRLDLPAELRERGRALVGGEGAPVVGLVPGANAPSRRWAPERFAEVAARAAGRGARVVVFGGPAERDLTAFVAGAIAQDLGGRTDLPLLAAALAACEVVVGNDTGPMHLAAAVGAATVSLFGAGDPAETGPLGEGQRVLRHAELPCVPCVRNVCPRRGRGYILGRAERECLALIGVPEVETALPAPGAGRQRLH